MTCCHMMSEMLLTIKNGEPIKGHTETYGDHCIFWQCTVENPIFTPHEGSSSTSKANCTCHFTLAGGPTLSLCLVHERHSQSENHQQPTITPCKMDGVWECGQGTHFFHCILVPKLDTHLTLMEMHVGCYHICKRLTKVTIGISYRTSSWKGRKHTTKCLNARGKKTKRLLLAAAGRTNTPPSLPLPPKCFATAKVINKLLSFQHKFFTFVHLQSLSVC
jgi:hypothetical protein